MTDYDTKRLFQHFATKLLLADALISVGYEPLMVIGAFRAKDGGTVRVLLQFGEKIVKTQKLLPVGLGGFVAESWAFTIQLLDRSRIWEALTEEDLNELVEYINQKLASAYSLV